MKARYIVASGFASMLALSGAGGLIRAAQMVTPPDPVYEKLALAPDAMPMKDLGLPDRSLKIMREGMVRGCLKKQMNDATTRASYTEAQLVEYCGCASGELWKTLTVGEMRSIKAGATPVSVTARWPAIIAACPMADVAHAAPPLRVPLGQPDQSKPEPGEPAPHIEEAPHITPHIERTPRIPQLRIP